jgi:hypothetical protein
MADPEPARQALARHAVEAATARAFGRASGAQRVVLLVDRGEEAEAAMVEWAEPDELALTDAGVTHALASGTAPDARPHELPRTVPIPATALDVDLASAELSAPLGALEQLASGLLALARSAGGRSVATAEYPTREPDRPLTLAARPGEPVVVAVAGQQFAMPVGWPAGAPGAG